ncbi:hypothetical protein [Cereibacter changlensis]|uniref:hypothetical protein n=1 Tax=Cereibacter changlensis TaxID=402884 RepID=UPI001B801EC4|nr:hypothetical protein [Cereibacter changlensis]
MQADARLIERWRPWMNASGRAASFAAALTVSALHQDRSEISLLATADGDRLDHLDASAIMCGLAVLLQRRFADLEGRDERRL